MVKPDVKVNYYAALDLGSDASIDDVKKQYRKLALKYHPDRNPGREEECNPKFQAISAAHEVLGDPTTKAIYDGDRSKANISGAAGPKPAASGQRGHPFTANSAFAPPPRRTADPTGWARGSRPGSSAGTGADRFTSFPKPAPTAKQAESGKTAASEAWSYVGSNQRKAQAQPQAQAQAQAAHQQQQQQWSQAQAQAQAWNQERAQTQAQAQRQRVPVPTGAQRQAPPPPPREHPVPPPRPDLPKREEDIRAGMNYRPAPSTFTSPQERTAYAHFNASQATDPRPGVQRSSTTRTPRRAGFDPSTPGSDERPAVHSNVYNTFTRSGDTTTPSNLTNHTQAQAVPRPNGYDKSSRPPSVDLRPPFSATLRNSTYHHTGGEKTFFSSDQLRRSHSTRDTTNSQDTKKPSQSIPTRHRSVSPGKPQSSNGHSKQTHFDLGDESDSSGSDSSSSTNSDSNSRPSQSAQPPRPKKVPTRPSSRLNGTSTANQSTQSAQASRRPSLAGQNTRQNSASAQGGQATSENMYDSFPSFTSASPASKQDWYNIFPFGAERPSPDTPRSSIPIWAIPSALHVPSKPSKNKQEQEWAAHQRASTSCTEDYTLIDITSPRKKHHTSPNHHGKIYDEVSHEADMHLLHKSLAAHNPATKESTRQGRDDSTEARTANLEPENLLTANLDRFKMNFGFDTQPQPKSRSAEEINMAFSSTNNAPNFAGVPAAKQDGNGPSVSGRSSPSRKGRESPAARSSATQFNTRRGSDQYRGPLPTATGPSPLFGEVRNEKTAAKSDTAFSPDTWAQEQFFSTHAAPRRVATQGVHGEESKTATMPMPPPPSVQDITDVPGGSGAHQDNSASADAMDIDPPVVSNSAPSQPARQYAMPPSPWRVSQGFGSAPPKNTQQTPSFRPDTDGSGAANSRSDMPSMNPLGASLNGTPGQGLSDFSTLQSTMPFPSKPSTVHPSKLFEDSSPTTALPLIPTSPEPPQKLTKTSWKSYTAQTAAYLTAYHRLQEQLIDHQMSTMELESKLMQRGPAGLEAWGESSEVGVEAYTRRVEEDERWRVLSTIAGTKHREALRVYVRVKERVKSLVDSGLLVE